MSLNSGREDPVRSPGHPRAKSPGHLQEESSTLAANGGEPTSAVPVKSTKCQALGSVLRLFGAIGTPLPSQPGMPGQIANPVTGEKGGALTRLGAEPLIEVNARDELQPRRNGMYVGNVRYGPSENSEMWVSPPFWIHNPEVGSSSLPLATNIINWLHVFFGVQKLSCRMYVRLESRKEVKHHS